MSALPHLHLATIYQSLGHGQSSRSWRIIETTRRNPTNYLLEEPWYQILTGDIWVGPQGEGRTLLEAVADLRPKLAVAPKSPRKKRAAYDIQVYRWNHAPDTWIVGVKLARRHVDIESFGDLADARAWLLAHREDLTKQLDQLRQITAARSDSNRPREGVDLRGGKDVTPALFEQAIGFRGVQFGNHVEDARRQQDLNDTHDALIDLAGVLVCAPSQLSLNGRLGLAFGARGRGGKGAALAHYELGKEVINLTKRCGAGSFAHEWWHAFDNRIARLAGRPDLVATELPGGAAEGIADPLAAMMAALTTLLAAIHRTDLPARAARLDAIRSKRYWSTPAELTARAFEVWVRARLARKGHVNDWLANVTPEPNWHPASCAGSLGRFDWPYPRPEELVVIRPVFDALFCPGGPAQPILTGPRSG